MDYTMYRAFQLYILPTSFEAFCLKDSRNSMAGILFLCPGVLEADGLVEDGMLGRAVGIDVEVADALEL